MGAVEPTLRSKYVRDQIESEKLPEGLMRRGRYASCLCFFFFQAGDGIRDYKVTGAQTCALPILEVMLTMRPNPRAAMPSTVALISSMGVSMLASTALSQAARSQSRKSPGGGPPALVTTMSKSTPGPPAADSTAARPSSVGMSAATASTFTCGARAARLAAEIGRAHV